MNAGVAQTSDDGLTPAEQLEQINVYVCDLFRLQDEIWRELRLILEKEGITVLGANELNASDREWLERRFMDLIFPVITPLAIDPARPFPFIPNLAHALALRRFALTTIS